jgi:hypothetical protein
MAGDNKFLDPIGNNKPDQQQKLKISKRSSYLHQ